MVTSSLPLGQFRPLPLERSIVQLKGIHSWNEWFFLETELRADTNKGFPRLYKLRSVPTLTIGNHRTCPEGMIPVESNGGTPSLLPESTEVSLYRYRA